MAFDRSLRRTTHRTAVSNFFATIPPNRRAVLTIRPDNGNGLGMGLENTGPSTMQIDSLGNIYTGIVVPDDAAMSEEEAIENIPSDRKINIQFHFISRGNPMVVDSNGERVPDRQAPNTIDHYEIFTLIGWGGEMMPRFPTPFHGGAEFCAHSCLPNAFLNHAMIEAGARGERPFTLSGTFDFQHYIDCNDGSGHRFSFDGFKYSFAPFFLHLTKTIQVGGRYATEEGLLSLSLSLSLYATFISSCYLMMFFIDAFFIDIIMFSIMMI
jgi:hypothetical protein